MKKISIIVPVYNVEPYLKRCVDSILGQTYQDFELILVDDGSTDGSKEICDEYGQQDDRIIVIHKENGGLSDARNAGLEIASAPLIGFVDSDDWIDCKMYERLVAAIERYDAQISCCGFLRTDGASSFGSWSYGLTECVSAERALKDIMVSWPGNVVVWNKLYRSTLFTNVRFPVGEIHEDNATFYQIIGASQRFVYIEGQYYYYFQRPNSIMNQGYSDQRARIVYKNIDRLEEYLINTYPQLMADYRIYISGLKGDLIIEYLSNGGVLRTENYKMLRDRFKGNLKLYLLNKTVTKSYKIKMLMVCSGLFVPVRKMYRTLKGLLRLMLLKKKHRKLRY